MANRPKQGEYTRAIYSWIRDGDYTNAIKLLTDQLAVNPNSRGGLSLLGYCYYNTQQFQLAAEAYQQLTQLCPSVDEYKVNYAMSLYQSCAFEEALQVTFQLENSVNESNSEILKLQAAIRYSQGDLASARTFLEQMPSGDLARQVNLACCLFKEHEGTNTQSKLQEAFNLFNEALTINPSDPGLKYNVALCEFKMKNYFDCMKHVSEIIEKGIREHPELCIGMATEGLDVKSVGNTITLHETALVEAFNLKSAVEYIQGNFEAANEALTDMPPRSEEELDPVTLHNQALVRMDQEPSEGFQKLQFLVGQASFPPETFANLLILFCKYEYFDYAADVMAENTDFTYKYLTPYLFQFLDALITMQTSPEDAFRKFDEMGLKLIDTLRKLYKEIHDTKTGDISSLKSQYQATLDLYMPVLMSQAKIYWDREMYSQVEKVFRKSVEFCSEQDVWKLNVAHVLFMQENKFKEATGFYEPLVKKNYGRILDVSAIVLANLCVSYIMTGQNEDAEELMRKIEKEEEHLAYSDPQRKSFHLCIVNLVIGTLYCVKGNFEFGISRVIKSLEPYSKKLDTETWFYSKRCFLSVCEALAKQTILLPDSAKQECLQFLIHCEQHGARVKAVIEPPLELETIHPGRNTVAFEARLLRSLFMKIFD